jgi:hypothetical protein
MNIVSRAEWGAKPARSQSRLDPSKVSRFVLHHTTGRYAGPQTVRQIQAFHQGPERGWADIGYNFLIAPDGTVFEGRGWGYSGAHARGYNATSIGAAFIGDGRQPVPDAALRSILLLAAEADRRFGKLKRVGHRDVGATACPGDVLYQWWISGPSLPSATPVKSPVSDAEVPSGVPTPEKGQVSSGGISEPPVDDWKYRPSWVAKDNWQRLIDWRKRQG